MNEQRNNGRGIFYGVIGVATLVVAIIGATFAYFTATQSNNNVITGNMATINFGLTVTQVSTADKQKGGMIPMSNSMVERAFWVDADTQKTGDAICTDDNGNAVCQVYKITVKNEGSATMFLDGYVTLVGGSGTPVDYMKTEDDEEVIAYSNFVKGTTEGAIDSRYPTMRWAQAFCTEDGSGNLTGCTTAGVTTSRATTDATGGTKGIDGANWDPVQDAGTSKDGLNTGQIFATKAAAVGTGEISGNDYDIIDKNFIRVSDHAYGSTSYNRDSDITSALVFNQLIAPKTTGKVGDSNDSDLATEDTQTYSDTQVYYIVVWLSENGKNQTAGETEKNQTVKNPAALKFFSGNVTFNSAQGSEVTATFSGYTAVPSE